MEKNYLKIYLVLGSVLTIITVAVFMIFMPDRSSLPAILSPLFYMMLSVAAIKIMDRPNFASILKFSNAIMLSNTVKMLLGLVYFVVSYLNIEKTQKMPFLVVFLLMYVVFAVMDTNILLRMFNNKGKNSK